MIRTFNLENNVVLITGGYGHLGSAITESLLFHGAQVYVLARNNDKFLQSFEMVDNLFFEYCDISDREDIKKAFNNIFAKTGKIDVLINNAFYSKGQSPKNMTDEEWEFGIDGTLSSVFRCIREIIPYFKEVNKGKIINVSSMYGVVAPEFEVYNSYQQFLNPPHYGIAKAGVIQLTKYYASYLGKYGINVNTVSPGPFPSLSVQKEIGFIEQLEKKTLLNRIGKPEDLAGAFIFLSSDASNFITGQNIIVDGGWTIK
jgi:NAD(P)-dependent dehydrogenase (short-subunit alcohol dehydrogenase family)